MNKIKFRLAFMLPLCAITITLILLSIYFFKKIQKRNNIHCIINTANSFYDLYDVLINKDAEDIAKLFNYIEQDKSSVEAFINRNRKLLYKETEPIFKAIKEAENASKIKANFLASMSHEIRTPINGLFASIELLMDAKLKRNQQELLEIA